MHSVEYNLQFFELAVRDLEQYLLSKVVFWNLGADSPEGGPPFPKLTLGGLKIIRNELDVQEPALSGTQHERLERARERLESLRANWRVAWEKKAVGELNNRLNLWGSYLEDLFQGRASADGYSIQAGNRVMAEYTFGWGSPQLEDSTLEDRLQAIDSRLRARFLPGPFLWDPALQSVYPTDRFWFLYGKPRPLARD